jgi:type IV pilus assembly protein PilV
MATYRKIGSSWNRPKRQKGTNLIEVMVALAILSIGLLGLAMMQLEGMRHNSDSYLRTQATFLASDIIERMRANVAGAASYHLSAGAVPATPTGTCVATYCDHTQLAAYDLYWWYNEVNTTLPQGFQASVSATNGTQYVVTLKWLEQIGKKDQTSSNQSQRNQHISEMVSQTWAGNL